MNMDISKNKALNLDKIVVGEITSIDTILKSEGLQGVMVDCGTSLLKTVSTKKNLKVGMKAAFAQLGAVLNNNTYVQIKEISGVESRGKLCSASDLGLSDMSLTIMEMPKKAKNGTCLSELV